MNYIQYDTKNTPNGQSPRATRPCGRVWSSRSPNERPRWIWSQARPLVGGHLSSSRDNPGMSGCHCRRPSLDQPLSPRKDPATPCTGCLPAWNTWCGFYVLHWALTGKTALLCWGREAPMTPVTKWFKSFWHKGNFSLANEFLESKIPSSTCRQPSVSQDRGGEEILKSDSHTGFISPSSPCLRACSSHPISKHPPEELITSSARIHLNTSQSRRPSTQPSSDYTAAGAHLTSSDANLGP